MVKTMNNNNNNQSINQSLSVLRVACQWGTHGRVLTWECNKGIVNYMLFWYKNCLLKLKKLSQANYRKYISDEYILHKNLCI